MIRCGWVASTRGSLQRIFGATDRMRRSVRKKRMWTRNWAADKCLVVTSSWRVASTEGCHFETQWCRHKCRRIGRPERPRSQAERLSHC